MVKNVCVIGSGGREHALSWKLAQSKHVKHVFVAPGNAGTDGSSTEKITNVDFNVKDNAAVSLWCMSNDIDLVVVGPEDPLANGLADHLKAEGIKCFGPCQKAAQIEASKEFAKAFMDRYSIPTAKWKSFTDAEEAKNHILSAPYEALVVKASGLAAGKGVVVGTTREEAANAVDELKQDLSAASQTLVIEELLQGEEVSVLCFSDGSTVAVMQPAQDHKRLLDDDKGPNTGGMGAYCKCPQVTDEQLTSITENILQKAVDGMKSEGFPYIGVLYAGLMMTEDGPKVLEFNCRFGDPETQVIVPLLESDLFEIMVACVDGTLDKIDIQWSKDTFAVGVVLVSGGYPGSYPKGKVIKGLDNIKQPNYLVFHAGTKLHESKCVTSGGRVLAVVALERTLVAASQKAKIGAEAITFEGVFYRRDIGHKAIYRSKEGGMTYKDSGVDIESADNLVQRIKTLTKSTMRNGVCGGIGGFGGIFDLKAAGYLNPYLVSVGKDIGEKLKVAQACQKHDTIGIDLVAICVNDIVSHGAEPLYFLDTFTCGKLDVKVADQVITGITDGCQQANCALIGGETAEMPGMYAEGDYDLTGFARGAVEKPFLIPVADKISEGDLLIGLSSSGLHCSGFDIINNIVKKHDLKYSDKLPFTGEYSLGDYLLKPTKIYVKSLLPLVKNKLIKAAIHIGEHGLKNSLLHSLPKHLAVTLDVAKWNVQDVFNWVMDKGSLTLDQVTGVFNCGLGMVVIVDQTNKNKVLDSLEICGVEASCVGHVVPLTEGQNKFDLRNWVVPSFKNLQKRKKVGVLISGSGTNLQSLIDYTQNPSVMSSAEIVLVLSNVAGVEGLKRAERAGIKTKVLSHKEFKSRVDFDMAVTEILKTHGVEIICLAGFMRILSKEFVEMWQGRILNVHPALLPAFKGATAHKLALDFGARITGCTVHFVEPEVDAGAIVEQAAVRVEIDDTVQTLQERVKTLEHAIFPRALELLASEKVSRGPDAKLVWNDRDSTKQASSQFKVPITAELQVRIDNLVRSTIRPGFDETQRSCGIFDLEASGYTDPYMVSGTDGVGTKLKIAQACNKHSTIGIDLVAMCVNDILTHGAEPLFFMECLVCGKLNPDVVVDVISGIAEGCKQANCALVGAEVAQMPDMYSSSSHSISGLGDYDVVGYAEGAVQKNQLLPFTDSIRPGDTVIGISSSGIHSNGYSLVRKLVEVKNLRYQSPAPFDNSQSLGDALLTPTKIYVKSVLPLMKKGLLKAAAHITGGGLTENIPRVLHKEHGVVLDASAWVVPPVLKWIEKEGNLSEAEMLKTFNCGLGMVLIVKESDKDLVLGDLKASGEVASIIGHVEAVPEGEPQVIVQHWQSSNFVQKTKKKVGVLISGSGTNLQALINYTQNPTNQSSAEIALVLSNKADATGLDRAREAGIATKVLNHKDFKSRVDFDLAVHQILKDSGVEIVCLAGFMRILSKEFVQLWQGKLLNVHPALLPAFKGMNAHSQALDLGVRITGCSVHFVEAEVDAGAVIEQAALHVDVNDTEETLQNRVKKLEHQIFPKALELLASEKISRGPDGKLVWHL